MISYIPFSKEFPRDYLTLKSKSNFEIISMKDNLLLRKSIIWDFNRKRQDADGKEINEKI